MMASIGVLTNYGSAGINGECLSTQRIGWEINRDGRGSIGELEKAVILVTRVKTDESARRINIPYDSTFAAGHIVALELAVVHDVSMGVARRQHVGPVANNGVPVRRRAVVHRHWHSHSGQ